MVEQARFLLVIVLRDSARAAPTFGFEATLTKIDHGLDVSHQLLAKWKAADLNFCVAAKARQQFMIVAID